MGTPAIYSGGASPGRDRLFRGTMPEKLRVLRAITRLNIGGPAIHAIILTRGLQNDRFASVLVTGQEGPREGSMRKLALTQGVRPLILNELGREVSPTNDLRATLRM